MVTPTIANSEVAIEILDNFAALRVVGSDVLDAIEAKVIVFFLISIYTYNERSTVFAEFRARIVKNRRGILQH
jgi:hypothetical protein